MNNRIIGNSKIIFEAIKKHDNIVVFHHTRPDGDCLGSQAGLAQMIRLNWPNKKVYVVGSNYENFHFLQWHFDPIESIDFTNSLAIVVDVSQPDRIENQELFMSDKFNARARIDHHEVKENEIYKYSWVDPDAAAAGEMVAQFAYEQKLKMDSEAALKTYLAIMTDSNRYQYSGARQMTQTYGSWLLQFDFDVNNLYLNLYKKTLKGIQFSGYVLSNFEVHNKILVFKASRELQEKFQMSETEIASYNNVLANIEDYTIWLFLVEQEDKSWRVRMRSTGPELHEIAAEFRGGGHAKASGATLIDIETELPLMINKLSNIQ
ncbi:phosphoesterase RecJ-like protein [Mycoplasma testudineum]|uniref:Phosphoesterase RecJ-like protein n=1 Tax=Mycoplasma testudineum TaxID=244584 RepID=A0A4R6ICA9_9MOLU|nr:bifunctional oligoribonuclease/PAP phosphatase NrnA [Mycoplasma testudineum]OYD26747.1 DHH family phosphoesterase [Mycoplasma testudineum]TDO19883.1 phosphoesterase RecJ-like protein [Mycoplasma testudineum]